MANADEFDRFYRDTAHRLLRYGYGLTGSVSDGQDIVQEAYARAWLRWGRLRQYADAEAWLRLVVTRLATDRWRGLTRHRARLAAQPPARPVDPPSEDVVLVVAAMRALPVPHRRALALYYLLDRSVADIAVELGVQEGTIKSWLSRGRARLAAELGDARDEATAGGSDGR